MKKKIITIAVAVCLMMTLAACGATTEPVSQSTDAFTVISRPAPEIQTAEDKFDIKISLSIRFLKGVASCESKEFALKIDKDYIPCKVFVFDGEREAEAGEKIVHAVGNDTLILNIRNAESFGAKKGKFSYGVYYKGICIMNGSHA